jgi:hypothetical protein
MLALVFHLEEALEHRLHCGEQIHQDQEGRRRWRVSQCENVRLRSRAELGEQLCARGELAPLRQVLL